MIVNVLTPGLTSPNGVAFLFPLKVFRKRFRESGIEINFFNKIEPKILNSDIILIDSKYHRTLWAENQKKIVDDLLYLRKNSKLIYCDTTDSAGILQSEVLDYVDVYAKSQIYQDLQIYCKPIYAGRLVSDFYHKNFGAIDNTPNETLAVTDKEKLNKICVSWNSGMANYSFFGPHRSHLARKLKTNIFLRYPNAAQKPNAYRSNVVSCRFNTLYSRSSVSMQREMLKAKLQKRLPTNKLGRRDYFTELKNSRIILSPFGWGEITLKDFEVFLTGGLLLKPNMDHMQTWPNFYIDNETTVFHRWDLSDVDDIIENLINNNEQRIKISTKAQEKYLKYTYGPQAFELFKTQFLHLLNFRSKKCS